MFIFVAYLQVDLFNWKLDMLYQFYLGRERIEGGGGVGFRPQRGGGGTTHKLAFSKIFHQISEA